eukprot:6880509-Prymnesium_polylepis.2
MHFKATIDKMNYKALSLFAAEVPFSSKRPEAATPYSIFFSRESGSIRFQFNAPVSAYGVL